MRKRYEKPVKPVFDGSGVVKGLDTAIGRVEQLRKVQKNVGDVFTKNLGVFGKTETSRLKEQMLLLDQSEERMRRIRADRDELVSMRGDEWNQLNRQILGNMSTLDALQKRYDELVPRFPRLPRIVIRFVAVDAAMRRKRRPSGFVSFAPNTVRPHATCARSRTRRTGSPNSRTS